jgi:hypothetical protein
VVAIEYELTPEEWIEVQLEHSGRSEAVKTAKVRVRVTFGALFCLLALLGWLMGSTTVALTWLIAGALGMGLLGPALTKSQRKQLERLAREGVGVGMFGPHRVELRPDGVLDSTTGYEWLQRWHAIDRVEEAENAFLIYSGRHRFLPIPHSAFPDAETLRRFADTFYALREGSSSPRLPESGAPGDP